MNTTICCLLYGDYPELAERCLKPISELHKLGADIRIGCNEISTKTFELVMDMFKVDENLLVVSNDPQIYKYPMMHKLFNIKELKSDYVMWFDDDSYIEDNPVEWLESVESFIKTNNADMIGSIYFMPTLGKQTEWRRLHCSWFKPEKVTNKTLFATGGWWAAKSSLIKKYDWPHESLNHRGGDVLLGELIKHEGLKLVKFNKGVRINADENGKESASKRRGYDEPPIGSK